MDPRDRLRSLPDGVECTVCGASVPVTQVTLLAEREDLVIVRADCTVCGSTALAFVLTGDSPSATDSGTGATEATRASASPIDTDDVLDMHAFLETWSGDLASLVGPARGQGRATRGGTRRGVAG
jgi:hypothetical protein